MYVLLGCRKGWLREQLALKIWECGGGGVGGECYLQNSKMKQNVKV